MNYFNVLLVASCFQAMVYLRGKTLNNGLLESTAPVHKIPSEIIRQHLIDDSLGLANSISYPIVNEVNVQFRRLTPQEKAKLKELYNDGVSVAEIAKRLRIKLDTVRMQITRAIKRGECLPRSNSRYLIPSRVITLEDKAAIESMYNDGVSTTEIAKRLGIKKDTVRMHITRAIIRGEWTPHSKRLDLKPKHKASIVSTHNNGVSESIISNSLGINRDTRSKHISRARRLPLRNILNHDNSISSAIGNDFDLSSSPVGGIKLDPSEAKVAESNVLEGKLNDLPHKLVGGLKPANEDPKVEDQKWKEFEQILDDFYTEYGPSLETFGMSPSEI